MSIMSHAQPKFNAKARKSTAGSRKKGKPSRRREEGEPPPVQEDPNASILVLKTKETKEAERREKLRQEVCYMPPLVPLTCFIFSLHSWQHSLIPSGTARKGSG
jgi:hypothetical protein